MFSIMKSILVTSELTFVPENYDRMINSSLEHSAVIGLIIIKNKNFNFLLKALTMIFTLAAPRLGWNLLKNYLSPSNSRRRQICDKLNKKIWFIENINSQKTVDILQQEQIDLLINARTRSIYKKAILDKPRLGCINIHHGLLPEQRGLMCDFWAHLENEDFGFSIHQMTAKIDDGPILWVEKINLKKESYLKSILKASETEALVLKKLVDQIAEKDSLPTLPITTENINYRKNPSLFDCYKLQIKGIRI